MKILLIDDSNFTRSMIKRGLLRTGMEMEIVEADGGNKGVEQFEQESPDIVLCDLLMPDMHGTEVVKHIRTKNPDCFVAIVSSDIQQSTQETVKDLGADIFIGKPFTPDKLKKLMESYEEKRGQ